MIGAPVTALWLAVSRQLSAWHFGHRMGGAPIGSRARDQNRFANSRQEFPDANLVRGSLRIHHAIAHGRSCSFHDVVQVAQLVVGYAPAEIEAQRPLVTVVTRDAIALEASLKA